MRRRTKNVDLVAAIAKAGMTHREVAVAAGITPETLSHAVNRRVDPRPETTAAIAKALAVPVANLGFEGGAA